MFVQLPTVSARAYVTGTHESRCELVVLHDIAGLESRVRDVCDALASRLTARVICPEFFQGSYAEMKKAPVRWLRKQSYDHARAIVAASYDWLDLQRNDANRPAAVVGFCYGGWVTLRLIADDPLVARIQAAVICHPTPELEKVIAKSSVAGLLKRQALRPLLCLASWNDPASVKPGGLLEKSLRSRGVHGRCVHFDSTTHGWITRGDWRTSKELRQMYNTALDMITTFLQAEIKLQDPHKDDGMIEDLVDDGAVTVVDVGADPGQVEVAVTETDDFEPPSLLSVAACGMLGGPPACFDMPDCWCNRVAAVAATTVDFDERRSSSFFGIVDGDGHGDTAALRIVDLLMLGTS